MTHSSSSCLLSSQRDPAFGQVFLSAQGDKCGTGMLWTIVSWNSLVQLPGMKRVDLMFLMFHFTQSENTLLFYTCYFNDHFFTPHQWKRRQFVSPSYAHLARKKAVCQVLGSLLTTQKLLTRIYTSSVVNPMFQAKRLPNCV